MKSSTWTLALAALLAAGCTARAPADTGRGPPELVLEGVGFKLFRGSELTTLGHARTASFRSDTGDLATEKVKLRFLRPGEDDVILEAGRAAGNVHTKQADAEDGVYLVDTLGTVARTERGHVDGVSKQASGTEPVEVTGPSFRSQAAGGFTLELTGSRTLAFQGPVVSSLDDLKGMP